MRDLVLAHKSTIQLSAARLSALDPEVPDSKRSMALSNLQSRLKVADTKSLQQADAVTELVRASAQLVARWQEISVVRSSECFAEWEARLLILERKLRRAQGRREQD